MNRRKYKNRPKLPKDCEEIKMKFENDDVLKKYGYTLDGDSKFYVNTILKQNHSFCVFQSQVITDFMRNKIDANERRYLIDGTFKTAAKPFKQYITISAEYEDDVSLLFYNNTILQNTKIICYLTGRISDES